ncbi:hypothetical protein ACSPNP_003427 [Acinetobacter baumannii]
MPHSKFLLQPLWVAMLAVSHSGLVFAESEKNDADNTLHSLAPIVVTAQQGNGHASDTPYIKLTFGNDF